MMPEYGIMTPGAGVPVAEPAPAPPYAPRVTGNKSCVFSPRRVTLRVYGSIKSMGRERPALYNPFGGDAGHADDVALVGESLAGDAAALERLVRRHQPWIYNIACRMVFDPDEAQDVTQEILIKLVTRLSTYDPERGAFRTWLYRIVANHVLTMKKARREEPFSSLAADGDYFAALERIVDRRESSMPENRVLAEESRMACITGMLLCLDRRSRLVFILGEIFDVSDAVGSGIVDTSRANFRTILSRSREKVYNFFSRKCGLISEENPCRCARAADAQVRLGLIDPARPMSERTAVRVSEALGARVKSLEKKYSAKLRDLYREGPFLESPDITGWIRSVLESGEFRDIFDRN